MDSLKNLSHLLNGEEGTDGHAKQTAKTMKGITDSLGKIQAVESV